jgi:uncharacterized protein (DUF305 family)
VLLTRRALLFGATLAAGSAVLAACGSGNGGMGGMDHGSMGTATAMPGMPGMGGMMGSATPAAGADYDRTFIDGMVPHHQAAIDMAKIAQRKAEHPELKQLADAIVADQDGEIAQMKAWRKAWYGSDEIAPGMGGHQMGGMDTDLKQLESASPFDKAFIDAMIPHHQSAIDMAKEAQTRATHQEIKDLAGRIITAQQKEIDQMKAWRAQWYPGQ